MSKNLQWYSERIGKRIYIGALLCPCSVCVSKFNSGTIISNNDHARYLLEKSLDHNIRYFDSKEERNKVLKQYSN